VGINGYPVEDTITQEPEDKRREQECAVMWADDYEALLKEVEEWRAFKEKNKGRWEGVAAAIKRQGMTSVINDAEVNAISGRRFEGDIDEANLETPEEAANDYVNQVHQLDRDGYTAEDVRNNAKAAYLAGYRDALAVPKSVQELRKEHGIGERPEHRDEIDAGKRCASDVIPETPEEDAERWAAEFWDEEGNPYNELMRACGFSGWLAGVKWALERYKR
jgi:hypothetical protein